MELFFTAEGSHSDGIDSMTQAAFVNFGAKDYPAVVNPETSFE